jgi:aminoglycoside 3-N-acetyltransferase
MLLQRFSSDLMQLGIRPGSVLLVHSSLSSLGYLPGGPETVIRALLAAIGPEGTLLLPALSYNLVTPDQPVFDLRATCSNIGAIPEYFRRREGTLRSMHPTHSVCGRGPQAGEILGEHDRDNTPVGLHSPFRKLRDLGGQILMLGCGLGPNTTFHGIEELVSPPYLFGAEQIYTLVDENGQARQQTYTTHGFDGWKQRYDRAAEILPPEAMKTGKVLQATAHLIEAAALWTHGLAVLKEDPLFFVDRT